MSDRMSKGTAGQSGASNWRKRDKLGVLHADEQRRHWWYQV